MYKAHLTWASHTRGTKQECTRRHNPQMIRQKFDVIFFDVGGTLLHVDWSRIASLLNAPEAASRLTASEVEARRFAETRASKKSPFTFLDYFLFCIEAAGLPAPSEAQREALSEVHLRENL